MGVSNQPLVGKRFKRILAVNLSMIGDLVMLSPALRTIRDNYPSSSLSLMCLPFGRELYSVGLVDEFIIYDKKGRDRGVRGFFRLVRETRRRNFDCAFIFHKSFGSALITYLAGIEVRVGYSSELRSRLLTHAFHDSEVPLHIVDEHLELLTRFGLHVTSRRMEVYPNFSYENHFFQTHGLSFLNSEPKPVIVICPQGGWQSKNWPNSHINRFLDLFSVNSAIFIIVGAPGEEEHSSHIYSINNTLINMVGKTTLRELCYIIKRADLVISPDTSIIHLAQAMNVPLIALFGPTPPQRCGPLPESNATVLSGEIKCQSLYKKKCDKKPCCMETIQPEVVKEVADRYLSQRRHLTYETLKVE